MQALVRNALADPFVLGVSSGASVGAVGVSVAGGLTGLGVHAVSAGAFLGALDGLAPGVRRFGACRCGLYAAAARPDRRRDVVRLPGADERDRLPGTGQRGDQQVLYWTMGGSGPPPGARCRSCAAVVLLGVAVLYRHGRSLDVMALGDETAASLGVNGAGPRRDGCSC